MFQNMQQLSEKLVRGTQKKAKPGLSAEGRMSCWQSLHFSLTRMIQPTLSYGVFVDSRTRILYSYSNKRKTGIRSVSRADFDRQWFFSENSLSSHTEG